MYAIVEIAGQQFKVEKNQEIFVHRLEGEKDSAVDFDNVLLLDHDGQVTVGSPTVNGAMIRAKIVEHLRGDKVIIFHKKRRKGYQKQNGHRQYFSKVLIEDILTDGKQPATEKKARVKKEDSTEKAPSKKAKAEAATIAEAQSTVVNIAEEPNIELTTPETSLLEVEGKTEE
jgi:large subunit ribosomal protein L21